MTQRQQKAIERAGSLDRIEKYLDIALHETAKAADLLHEIGRTEAAEELDGLADTLAEYRNWAAQQ